MASLDDREKLGGRVVAGVVGGLGCGLAWGGLVARLTDGGTSGLGDTAGGIAALLVWITAMMLAFVAASAVRAWCMLLIASAPPIIFLIAFRIGMMP